MLWKAAILVLAASAMVHTAAAQPPPPYHDLDGSGSFALPDSSMDTRRADEIYLEDGERYEIYEQPRDPEEPSWHRAIWQSASIRHSGMYSLAFEGCVGPIPPSTNTCPRRRSASTNVADRVELSLDSWATGIDGEEVKLDKTRYVTFQLLIHPDTEVPRNWTLIHQVGQTSKGDPPPFAVFVQPDSGPGNWSKAPITLLFVVRNDLTDPSLTHCGPAWEGGADAIPAEDRTCPHEAYRIEATRGVWNRFIIQLRPSLDKGQLAIWQNKSDIRDVPPDAIYRGPWGYSHAANEFDVRVGIYRRQQQRRLKLMFDDIRLGPTAASVTQ